MPTPTPLSSSIFRRGGTKQELFNNVQQPPSTGAPGEEPELVQELEQLATILQAPKAGHDLSAAIWRPSVGAAEMVLVRKETGQPMGFRYHRRRYLHIEEAVFLVDRADLLLFVEQEGDEDAVPGYTLTGGGSSGTQPPPRHRLLSMQECFELMELCGVSMERYIVYSTLSRSGYLVMRYPSCWVLDPAVGDDLGRQLTPKQVWGLGAWAGACQQSQRGLHQHHQQQQQQQHQADGGEVQWAAEQCTRAARMRGMHQGEAPACMVMDNEDEEGEEEDTGAVLQRQGLQLQVGGQAEGHGQQGVGGKRKLDSTEQQQQQQRQGGVRQVRQFAPPPAPDPVAEALAATAAAATAEQVTSAAEVKKEAAKKQEGGDGQKEDQEEEEELEPLPNRANIRVPPVLVPPQWAGPSAGAIAGTLGRPPRMELLLPSTLLVHPLHMDLWQAQHMMPSLLWRLEGMVCAHELRERLRSTLVHGSAAGKGLKRNDEGSVGNDSAAACAKQESTQESEEQQQQQLQQPQAEEKGKGVDSQDVLQAALPPLRDVLAALTAASSNEGYCCEGVELVGDTVLGYLAAVHLFNTLRSSHEGVLSECKVRLVANEVLLEVTTGASSRRGSSRKLARAIAAGKAGHPHQERLMMQRYIRANTLDVTHFWGKGALVGDKKRIIKSARGKRVADSVEALLGATFLASGGGLALGCIGTSQAQLQPAQQAASRNVTPSEPLLPVQQQQQQQPLSQHNLQVPWATTCSLCSWDAAHLTRALASTALLSERMTIMPPFSSRELKRLLTGESHNAARQENEKALEQPSNLSPDVQPARLTLQERQDRQLIAAMAPLLGGYEFRDAALLREALTHCSCPHPPCNQRLEFLGDAAIEMLAVCHLLANPQSRICPPDQGSASLPPATTGLLLRDPEDPKDEGPAPPLPVPPLDPGVLHISRSTLIANRTLALMCAKSGLWRHMRAGLRHVTRLAASYVAGVSRPISCCKEDVATVAAKAAVASHGNARYTAMETELPCASAKPQQLLDNGTNEDAAKSCNDKENRDGNKEDEGEDAPKLLADLVEAVLGGVLIDCDGGGGRGLVAAWNAYCGLARAAGMDRDLRLVVD
uniref:RNase III domain-containing protein n=1 Tax=Dunaliella tertiolecta TaxID=3047 RepID=A0A7S3QU62_DUNTE